MRYFLFLGFLIWGTNGATQISTINLKNLGNAGSKIWAVVVGISDYQDEDIPDLRFAHRDAEAFAKWLQSPAGGSLEGDHLKMLLNNQATAGRVAEALDALLERVEENDKVFIYFSGHGDVERKTFSQPGFLLCWDAPSRVYMGGGTYSLAYLQEIVTSLTLQNKAKVTVIADACRAGKLAGSQVGGPQLTSANLQRQQANELKILSCQPDEYSLEGTQWGGGRGIFSYHLMDGLYGLADRNEDGVVTIGELDRYLEDYVTAQAEPESQVPVLLGNKTEVVAEIHAETLADFVQRKSEGKFDFAPTVSRGIEDDVLGKLDSVIVDKYHTFKKAVAEKRFFHDLLKGNAELPADVLYIELIDEPGLSPLYGAMIRNYAAALQDDAQQTINQWLTPEKEVFLEDIDLVKYPKINFTDKVRTYPRYLERAAELLGEEHYFYPILLARKYFFEGFILTNSNRNPNQVLGQRALGLFQNSLDLQPEQPHVYWQMGLVFGWNLQQPDSLDFYTRQALTLHSNWDRPCLDAAFVLSAKYKRQDQARWFLDQARQIDSLSAALWSTRAVLNFGDRNFVEAERELKRALEIDSLNVDIWSNLGYLYNNTEQYDEAERVLEKALLLDSTLVNIWNNLGITYSRMGRLDDAILNYKKSISLDSTFSSAWLNLGTVYYQIKHYEAAEPLLKKAISIDSTLVPAWLNIGMVSLEKHQYSESTEALKKVISLDSNNITAWVNLGYVYLQTNRFNEAEFSLIQTITIDSNHVTALNNLGFVYIETSRYDKAEHILEKAIALDSTEADIWNNLGRVFLETRRYTQAEQAFEKAIALDQTLPIAWHNLGISYLHQGQYDNAESVLRNSIVLNPYYDRAWGSLGALYYQIGRLDKAEPLFFIANTLDSKTYYYQAYLGLIYLKTHRIEEARYNFIKALELNPDYIRAILGMACVLQSEGKTDEAIDNVDQAIGKGCTMEQLESDEDLAPLRTLPEWQALMKKHFPNQDK